MKNSPRKGLSKSVSFRESPLIVGFNDVPEEMGFQDEQKQSHLPSGSSAKNKFFLDPINVQEDEAEDVPQPKPLTSHESPSKMKPIMRVNSAYVGSPRIGGIHAFAEKFQLKRTYSARNLRFADSKLQEHQRKIEKASHPTTPHPVVKPKALDLMVSRRFIERTSRMQESPRPRKKVPYYMRKADILGANQPGNPFWKSAAAPRKPRARNQNKPKKKPPPIKARPRFSALEARNFAARLRRIMWKKDLPRLLLQQPMLKLYFLHSSLASPLKSINSSPSGIPS